MIIDTHCYWGNWPFSNIGDFDSDRLRITLMKSGITKAFVSPSCQAICKDEYTLDKMFLADIEKHRDFFLPLASLNLKEDYWQKRLQHIQSNKFYKGIILHPATRFFNLDDSNMIELLSIDETFDLPIFVSTAIEEERLRPLALNARVISNEELKNFISLLPKNRKVAILGVNGPDIPELMAQKTKANLFFDSINSNMYNFYKRFKSDRIVFGSMAPICMAEPVRYNLEMTLGKNELNKIFYENISSWII